jgi:ankyrin repeat protein
VASPLEAALYRKQLQVRVRGSDERSLLHSTSQEGLADTARWLLNHGTDAKARKNDGWTPLLLGGLDKRLGTVQMLLKYSADIHARNGRGEVALQLAACRLGWLYDSSYDVNLNLLQLSLDHGADVDAKDNEGLTSTASSTIQERGQSFRDG